MTCPGEQKPDSELCPDAHHQWLRDLVESKLNNDDVGSPGVNNFLALLDTISSYAGLAGQLVKVNDAETGLDTADASALTYPGTQGDYVYDANTAIADPGVGNWRGNSVTLANITILAVSKTANNGVRDVFQSELRLFDRLFIQHRTDGFIDVGFTLLGEPVDQGAWYQYSVVFEGQDGVLPTGVNTWVNFDKRYVDPVQRDFAGYHSLRQTSANIPVNEGNTVLLTCDGSTKNDARVGPNTLPFWNTGSSSFTGLRQFGYYMITVVFEWDLEESDTQTQIAVVNNDTGAFFNTEFYSKETGAVDQVVNIPLAIAPGASDTDVYQIFITAEKKDTRIRNTGVTIARYF